MCTTACVDLMRQKVIPHLDVDLSVDKVFFVTILQFHGNGICSECFDTEFVSRAITDKAQQ